MAVTTNTHNRTIREHLEVEGTNFRIHMGREEQKIHVSGGRAFKRKIDLHWFLNGFKVWLNITKEVDADNETVEYVYNKAGQTAVKAAQTGLSDILSLDEKRTMLRAIDELNEWQKMNSHLPELGDWVWRIAMDAKLSEAK